MPKQSGDKPYIQGNIETTGRLVTAIDPTQLGKGDFQLLSNMRYTDRGIRSVKGMTKVNADATSKVYLNSMYQFINPYGETHLLAQAVDSGGASLLLDKTAAIGTQGDFSTLFVENGGNPGAGTGVFSEAPDGAFCYGNGKDQLIWGGKEARVAGFQVADTDGVTAQPATLYDFLENVSIIPNAAVPNISPALIKKRYVHIASTRQLQGVKFYVGTANTQSVVPAVKYWNGTAWTAVSNMVDGTATTGKTLAKTGEISFDSTVGAAQVKYFNNTVLYWYLFDFNGVDATTAVFKCTVDAPIQPITNIWDGFPIQITSFQVWDAKRYNDHAAQVFQQDYVSGAATTFYNLKAFPLSNGTTGNWIAVGFAQRMTGLRFHLAPSTDGSIVQGNTTASTMTVEYWNGTAWVALTINDDTKSGAATLNCSGQVTWLAPAASLEFENAITTKDRFYYYRVRFSAKLSAADIPLDWIEGIPLPGPIDTYRVPVMFQGRLMLLNDVDNQPNVGLMSAQNTNDAFNGVDSTTLYFGDDGAIVAAKPFFSRFSNSFFENLIVCKSDSVFVLEGIAVNDPNGNSYAVDKVSTLYGCTAPATMVSCDVGLGSSSSGAARQALLWQSASAIILWDGSTLLPVSDDIKDVFDQTNSYAIEPTMIGKSSAFFDEANTELHWLWASKGNTTYLNMESVFDLVRKKWYTIDRGTGNRLQAGCSAMDVNGNRFSYGGTNTGFAEWLENGTTFDGTAITSTWWTGDIPLGGWMVETEVRHLKPIFKAKNTTTNTLSISHYADTNTAADQTMTFTVASAVGRLATPKVPVASMDGRDYAVFHSFKCSMTTNNEYYAFEPIGLGILYRTVRENII